MESLSGRRDCLAQRLLVGRRCQGRSGRRPAAISWRPRAGKKSLTLYSGERTGDHRTNSKPFPFPVVHFVLAFGNGSSGFRRHRLRRVSRYQARSRRRVESSRAWPRSRCRARSSESPVRQQSAPNRNSKRCRRRAETCQAGKPKASPFRVWRVDDCVADGGKSSTMPKARRIEPGHE